MGWHARLRPNPSIERTCPRQVGVCLSSQTLDLTPQAANGTIYSSVRPVFSRSCSYRLASGKGGNQDSRRTVQSS